MTRSLQPLIFALALGAVTLTAPPVRAATTAEDHEEEGARLYRQKQYDGAIKEFQAAYALEPLPRYLFNIGQAYRRLGYAQEAVDYYLRFLQLEPKPDPTIKVDLDTFIATYQAEQEPKGIQSDRAEPEPPPQLVQEEIADAEELFEQYVRDYKAGNLASASDLLNQMKEVYAQRRDPVLLFYMARSFDRVGNRAEALDAYRRYLATEPSDPQRRATAAAQVLVLTPPPPGRKFLYASAGLAAVGLAGVVTGVGLFFAANSNLEQFQVPADENQKRDLKARGETLGLASLISYGAGGAFLATSVVLLGVALKKGVRQRQEAIQRPAPPAPALPGRQLSLIPVPTTPHLRLGVTPLLGGGALWLQGAF